MTTVAPDTKVEEAAVPTAEKKLPPNTYVIAGKQVVLRDRFPAKDFYPLRKVLVWFSEGHNVGDRDLEEDIIGYLGTVISWEFDGDPKNADAWYALDLFTELPQLIAVINDHILNLISEAGKKTKN